MKASRLVVAGILLDSNRILMGRRQDHDGFYGGHWEFPGGKVEEGESNEEALHREYLEELGVSFDSCQFFKKLSWQYPQLRVEVHFYLIQMNESTKNNMKNLYHSELRWFSLQEALVEKILPANKTVIDHLLKNAATIRSED